MKWKCPKCGDNKLVHLEDYVTIENPINELDGRLVVDYEKKEFIGEDTEHRIMCNECGEVFSFEYDYDEIISISYNNEEVWQQIVEE